MSDFTLEINAEHRPCYKRLWRGGEGDLSYWNMHGKVMGKLLLGSGAAARSSWWPGPPLPAATRAARWHCTCTQEQGQQLE